MEDGVRAIATLFFVCVVALSGAWLYWKGLSMTLVSNDVQYVPNVGMDTDMVQEKGVGERLAGIFVAVLGGAMVVPSVASLEIVPGFILVLILVAIALWRWIVAWYTGRKARKCDLYVLDDVTFKVCNDSGAAPGAFAKHKKMTPIAEFQALPSGALNI